MSQPLIQGRLKIQRENLNWDLPTVEQLVTAIGTPQLRKEFGNEQKEFWSVDFTATPMQWNLLRSELSKMQIEVNLYEAPDLLAQVEEAEKRDLKRIEEKNELQLVWLAGFGLLFVAYAGYAISGNFNLTCALIITGIVVIALGRTLVDQFTERASEELERRLQRSKQ